jgi:hypothetical protein
MCGTETIHHIMAPHSHGSATFATRPPQLSIRRRLDQHEAADPCGNLTTVARKPSLVIEQATSPYSFRSSELSQPI